MTAFTQLVDVKHVKIGTIRIKLPKTFNLRMRLCVLLVRLAAWVCPMKLDTEIVGD